MELSLHPSNDSLHNSVQTTIENTVEVKYRDSDVVNVNKNGGMYQECKICVEGSLSVENRKDFIMKDGMHNVDSSKILETNKNKIDNSKLLFPIHVDHLDCKTNEEFYDKVKTWWINTKNRAERTIDKRIQTARTMNSHDIFPINWMDFNNAPEHVINHLMYLINVEYSEKGKITGNKNYGIHEIHNRWKTINTFAEAIGVDISWWGWSPPPRPENKVKHIPRPEIVNKLMHYKYTNHRFTNALIKTILTVGFESGLRPEELMVLQVRNVDFENGFIIITEQKKRHRNRQIWLEKPVIYSHQQNSLKNWITIWRPYVTDIEDGFLFLNMFGRPFSSEDAFRRFLSRYCKPVWNYFCPKIMRDWNAIARLIRTKNETKNWQIREVTKALGHKFESTTEVYVEFAEQYYKNDKYDWLRAVLKFHPDSKRMKRLMGQDHGTGQELSVKLTNDKKGSPEIKVPSVEDSGPRGVRSFVLLLEISSNNLVLSFFFVSLIKPFWRTAGLTDE